MTVSPNVIDNILIQHTAFRYAIVCINACFDLAERKGSSDPICLAVIGESGTGKSRVLESCCLRHPSKRLGDGMIIPILRVDTPAKPTVKGMIEVMLDALGVPDSHRRGTENEKTRQLKKLLKESQTVMIVIDEFQHFVDKGTRAVIYHVADWLKLLVNHNDVKCALVVAGLPTCEKVIETNVQLGRRFLAPVHLPRFSWENIEQRREFKAILRSFYEELKKEFDIPELYVDEMAFRFYCASGGLMGYLTQILRQAIWQCIMTHKSDINLADFDAAHASAVWTPMFADAPKPFRPDFQLIPTAELLKAVSLIGTETTPIEPSERRRRRSVKMSAAEMLVTK